MNTIFKLKSDGNVPADQSKNGSVRTAAARHKLAEEGMAYKRDVWTVTTGGSKEDHYASYPQELIVDCIKAGSSEHGCCADCGRPYERILIPSERYQEILGEGYHDHNNDAEAGIMQVRGHNIQNKMREKEIFSAEFINTGWERTCSSRCKSFGSIVKSIVLDPFGGNGTTAIVASKLHRDFILIEGNPHYIKDSKKRLHRELQLFNPQ